MKEVVSAVLSSPVLYLYDQPATSKEPEPLMGGSRLTFVISLLG